MPIKIFADGATLNDIEWLENNKIVRGYTFNPSLLRKSGVTNFEEFAKKFINSTNLPISFEVFSDTWEEMERDAKILSSWGKNVYVKIPITNSVGIKTAGLVEHLVGGGIKLNITCIFTYRQIDDAIKWLGNNDGIISVFAGRISDTGIDPTSFIQYASYNKKPNQQILWASTRGIWNIRQAEESHADIITVGTDILKKMNLIGKDLNEFSLETVKMFRTDAIASGYKI